MKNWVETSQLEIEDILKILPHRYPFLLVDRVLEIKPSAPLRVGMSAEELVQLHKGSYVRTLKNVTMNEPQFQGHFPEMPVFPGVLSLEAMAQSAAFIVIPFAAAANKGMIPKLQVALAGIDHARFRKPVKPGDQLEIRTEVRKTHGAMWSFESEATVAGKRVAEGGFLAQLNISSGEGNS